MATNIRDPRTIITPDAFAVSERLLGTPLATPGRRLAAILIDLLIISVLTAVTSSISFIIWGVVGLFFLQMAFRAPSEKLGQVTSVLFRGATGCLGLTILLGVGIGYLAVSLSDDGNEIARSVAEGIADGVTDGEAPPRPDLPAVDVGEEDGGSLGLARLVSGLSTLGSIQELQDAGSEAEARTAVLGALEALRGAGMADGEAVEFVEEVVPAQVSWTDDRDAFVADVLEEWRAGEDSSVDEDPAADEITGAGEAAVDSAAGISAEDAAIVEVATMTEDEVVIAWAARIVGGDTASVDPLWRALDTRAVPLVAGDTLATMDARIDDLVEDLDDTRDDLTEARTRIEAGEAGFTGLLRDIWDQLGSAFGLWSIYFTVLLTLFRGQTIGKRLLGLRVLRLDGEPLTWWSSFERSGGYFAGIATGLLGFVQVYWDPNRQMVHDKIVGTVVVKANADPIPGSWAEAAGSTPIIRDAKAP